MTCGIYIITNLTNGKLYVGRSINIEARWHTHTHTFRKGNRHTPLYNAFKKYGVDKFSLEIVLEADAKDLPDLELLIATERGAFGHMGYNVGGTHSGFPPATVIAGMPKGAAARLRASAQRASAAGNASLKALRLDPAYEAAFLVKKAAASTKREQNIRAKRAADPLYDAAIFEKRSSATKSREEGYQHKGATVFKERMLTDPVFAAQVKANRQRANAASLAARRRNAEAAHA